VIRLDADVCGDLQRARRREWLETNGIGGFASSTIAGLNTRRYHGLLVAATRPPVGRMVLLSKFEETLIVDGQRTELSSNQYPGVIHPDGWTRLREFRLDPFPIARYDAGGVVLEKSVCMIQDENTTVVVYELSDSSSADTSVEIELRPLLACREYHALAHENDAIDRRVHRTATGVVMHAYPGVPAVHIGFAAGAVEAGAGWYRRFEYEEERTRGLDFVEDLFNPCVLRIPLNASAPLVVSVSTQPVDSSRALGAVAAEAARRRAITRSSEGSGPLAMQLTDAADRFVVRRGHGHTIVAGYPWFTDWGRDTMIALPGIAIATGRLDVARDIVAECVRHVSRGMIPNRFSDSGDAEYTAADASLWLFHAVHQLRTHSSNDEFVRAHLYEPLTDIIDWHVRGTRHNIHVDHDGLLAAGPADVALTWMDVKVGDRIVTPRFGKPVELQALWYNALQVMMQLAERFGDQPRATSCAALAARARQSFLPAFWNPTAGCLCDVVDGAVRDESIRPNQVIAVSLPFSMVTRTAAVGVLTVVERELLTPYGLRTLSPSDLRYRARYDGGVESRDTAYHQGTVWPWLFGPFATACLRIQPSAAARARIDTWLERFRGHLAEAGLGQVSEVFDGDPPHRPGGCIAQAWSVAELLRVALSRPETMAPL
jgi:predicted glycogen debranching enzyme